MVLSLPEAAALKAGLETGSVYSGPHNPGFVSVEYFGSCAATATTRPTLT